MRTMENSEDPDEMPHNAEFRQVIHYLLRQNKVFRQIIQLSLEIITYDPRYNMYIQ